MPAKKSAKRRRTPRRRTNKRKSRNPALTLLLLPDTIAQKLSSRLPGRFATAGRIILLLAFVGLVIALGFTASYMARAAKYDLALVAKMPERTIIYDRDGEEIGRLHGEKRDVVSIDDISPVFIKAILAREDARFYDHGAVDWKGIARAFVVNVKRGRVAQGASTITMQLARNSFPLGGDSLDRKLLEIAVAHRIEREYSKQEILQHYANRIFWGHTIQGVEEASRTYFEKSAADLTLGEAAMLAGIVRGPNAFSPFKDTSKATRERDTTLDSMVRFEFITAAEAEAAKSEPLEIRPEGRRIIERSYAFDAVRRDLELILAENNIQWGGLRVHTTIDLDLQNRAISSLNERLSAFERRSGWRHQTRAQFQAGPQSSAPTYVQGAVVSIDNATGAVRTIVGGRDAGDSQLNRAYSGKPIASTFKPFFYARAYEKGLKPNTLIDDGPLASGEIDGVQGRWNVANSDGEYNGRKPAAWGLIRSRNTMSVRVGNYVGLAETMDFAHRAGFSKPKEITPSNYLGNWDASPYQVATAYSMLANLGKRMRPYLIESITDQDGEVLYTSGHIPIPTLSPGAAWAVTQNLRSVTQSGGTAGGLRRYGIRADAAGKTGTGQDYRAAWFAGYVSSLTTVVWVGMDDNSTIMDRGYGSTLAVPVWADIMKSALALGYEAESLVGSQNLVQLDLCRLSGSRATSQCYATQNAYRASVPEDLAPPENDFCPIHPEAAERVDPNAIPPEVTPAERVEITPAERVVPRAERVN